MKVLLLLLAVTAVAMLALSSGSMAAPRAAFADELKPIPAEIIIGDDPCCRFCNGTTTKFCGLSPSGRNGCNKIVNNNCIYSLCAPDPDCSLPE